MKRYSNIFPTRLTSRWRGLARFLFLLMIAGLWTGCEREPELHLHRDGDHDIDIDMAMVDIDLEVYWDYTTETGIPYSWQEEWFYGWDDIDLQRWGQLGYTEPSVFNLRRYLMPEPFIPHTSVLQNYVEGYTFTGHFDWGWWDFLAWNDIETLDGIQSLIFDETTTLDSVFASTNQSMVATRYTAPRYTRAFYQPEALFGGYVQGEEINRNLDGFVWSEERQRWVKTIPLVLMPETYIYLTQVILHHNNGRVASVDGSANLSGMSRSVNVNTGVAGQDVIVVNYNVRLKNHCTKGTEDVDIVGGRLMTFGLCGINGSKIQPTTYKDGSAYVDDGNRHYIDMTMQFNNGMDSTFVFDVTDQVRKRYKGGVITIELDMDTVPIPSRSGGSGFDAVVVDFEDGGTHEFDM